jgi:O-methyltransferase
MPLLKLTSISKQWLATRGCHIVKVFGVSEAGADAPVEFSSGDSLIVEQVVDQGVDGDFVECGVWRGGNSLIAADVFARAGASRGVYLFDTFAGMTEPTAFDVRAHDGSNAMVSFSSSKRETHSEWCYASLEEVRGEFADLGLLGPNVRFVEGDVIESLKNEANLPKTIAVLRLDTDWYESTRVELEVLYPRLGPGGVLIVDDYGHWGGVRKAVDEYFEDRPKPLLQYTDYAGRMGLKPL